LGAALAAATLGAGALAASASAAVPSFDRCPRTAPDVVGCVVIQSTDGHIAANGHNLPLGDSIKVEGAIAQGADGGTVTFVPPASGPALTARPVDVPGGLFGAGYPYSFNSVKATVEQVGTVGFDYTTLDLTLPIRIRFTNALLGANCVIGSTATPITLHLTTGLTSPPPPNTPISGAFGTVDTPPGTAFALMGNLEVDNAFAVPAATGCGIVAQSQVTKTINNNLGLPSAAGHNDAALVDDVYFAAP
jgi:hypothetical protein